MANQEVQQVMVEQVLPLKLQQVQLSEQAVVEAVETADKLQEVLVDLAVVEQAELLEDQLGELMEETTLVVVEVQQQQTVVLQRLLEVVDQA